MPENYSTNQEKESPFKPGQSESPGPKNRRFWEDFDWSTILATATITTAILGIIATLLWSAIDNVDDDVDRLTGRVNQIDDKLDERMEKIGNKFDKRMSKITEKMDVMTGDIAFIKGHIKSISKSANNHTSQQLLSAKGKADQQEKEIPLNLSILRK